MNNLSKLIEAQESAGQNRIVKSCELPAKANPYDEFDPKAEYEKMGIKVIGPSKDPLFLDVQLPEGWSKRATDHPMWNDLIDANGGIRANFFYKASFHDRDSFINFNHRYYKRIEFLDNDLKYYCVKDNQTGAEKFITEMFTGYNDDVYKKMCVDYLNKNFPDHENIHAYWI